MEGLIRKLVTFSIVILAAGLVVMFLTERVKVAVPFLVGWLISFANSIVGIIVIERAFQTAGKGFINTILLSMVVRMFAIVGIVAVLIIALGIDKINLAVSLFLFYFLFLVIEIRYLQDRQKERMNVQQ